MKTYLPLLVLLLVLSSIIVAYGSNLFSYSYVKSLDIYAPAVSGSGQGVLSKTRLAIAYPGSGRVFFSALPYTELDTQGAARIAAYVASILAGVRFDDYDYYVLTESSVPIIGGPSSGGLMTVGFLALLTNKTLSPSVTMTGMINPDGTIGPVGGLKEKLDAAAQEGFKVFLIPMGQRYYQYPVVQETQLPWGIIRRVSYQTIDLVEYGSRINVSVIEVKSVIDAFKYFTGVDLSTTQIPIPSVEIPSEVVDSMLSDLNALINEAYTEASRIPYLNYRAYILTGLNNLNTTLSNIYSLKNTYPAYVLAKGLSMYNSVMYYNLLSKILSNSMSIDKALDYVNATLITVGYRFTLQNDYYSMDSLLMSSIAKALYYRAGYYYSTAMSSSQSNQVTYIAYSLSYARQAEAFLNISLLYSGNTTGSTRGDFSIDPLSLYAVSSSIYSYTEAVISEAGGNTQVLSDASDYYNLLVSQVTNDTMALLGFSIGSIGESIYAMHLVFDQSNLGGAASAQKDLLSSLLAKPEQSMALLYFLRYGLESLSIGDYQSAVEAFSTATSIYLVTQLATSASKTSASPTSQVTESPSVTPTTSPDTNTTTTTPVNTESTNGGSLGEGVPGKNQILSYLALAIAVLALISVYTLLRMSKHRMQQPGPS